MNEQTIQLIRELADKLGTTAEHLWGVLIRQAPIYSASYITTIFVILGALLWLLRNLKASIAKVASDDFDGDPIFIFGVVANAIGIIAILLAFSVNILPDISMIFAGFFNPEYWALKQILK